MVTETVLTLPDSTDALLDNYNTLTQKLYQHLTHSSSAPLKQQQHHSKPPSPILPNVCIQQYIGSCTGPPPAEDILQITSGMQEKRNHKKDRYHSFKQSNPITQPHSDISHQAPKAMVIPLLLFPSLSIRRVSDCF